MKTISVNGTPVVCQHEVKIDPKTHHTAVHLTVTAGTGDDAVVTDHQMTIGSVDEPLPPAYDAAALQKDLDAFRAKSAAMAESKLRAKKLAKGLT